MSYLYGQLINIVRQVNISMQMHRFMQIHTFQMPKNMDINKSSNFKSLMVHNNRQNKLLNLQILNPNINKLRLTQHRQKHGTGLNIKTSQYRLFNSIEDKCQH